MFRSNSGPSSIGFAWENGNDNYFYRDPLEAFKGLWESINGKGDHGWAANPWVWVVEFRVI